MKNAAGDHEIRLIVVTDAEGILGIGDWGTNGVDISVGKLMVYTGAAGIDPSMVLPLVIDAGTNREELRNNPNYLGIVTNGSAEIVTTTSLTNLFKQQNVSFLNSTFTGKTSAA